ncbi:hypothetical protein [Aeromicrobium yanjiei]|uniref:Uncharacterized protein n=1 Tax=Aeromicrobium yanjiei TaxID=2662028 RepID=A0A5Q2MNY8_9ACTN|nr:hypothetical protein [Aeromicrobium yanjiei]QGG43056.1 hypothetical protein GEV26_17655 [Aeromicrobium yanjiei]
MDPIRHAEAYERGFTPHLLRTSPHFVHPVAGVAQLAASADDLASTCRAVALQLPDDAVFTHLTSAQLRGWWLPMLDGIPIIACTDRDAPHHDRRGVYVRRCAIPPGHGTGSVISRSRRRSGRSSSSPSILPCSTSSQ